jgi:uncharacterized membrane protein YqgA involved in biofilm formation
MIGTVVNVAGVAIGGVVGIVRRQGLTPANESFFKVVLGVFTVWFGLKLTWTSLNGSLLDILRQLIVAILALTLGRLTGRLLHLQKFSNRLGQFAKARISNARPEDPQKFGNGFSTAGVLFCAAPLGILGAVQDGMSDYFYPLAVKGVMDGLAAMGFAMVFGPGVLLAILPLLAFQGTITLLILRFVRPWLEAHSLVDPINAVGGLLVFSVALVILQLKKVELADYLPSLVMAPIITWFWH